MSGPAAGARLSAVLSSFAVKRAVYVFDIDYDCLADSVISFQFYSLDSANLQSIMTVNWLKVCPLKLTLLAKFIVSQGEGPFAAAIGASFLCVFLFHNYLATMAASAIPCALMAASFHIAIVALLILSTSSP